MAQGSFVAYYRVSTDRQGRSGLGLEAQQTAVRDYLNGGDWKLVGEFTETESGRRDERPELDKALALCRRQKAKLVIAKLDRLSRNLAFIARLMDAGVEFIAVDNPHANKLTIHILAAVAQHEREMIAERTKAALAAAKARGTRLGRNGKDRLAPAYEAQAIDRAKELAPVVAEIRAAGASSLRAIAQELNARGITATGGGKWSAMQVKRVTESLGASGGLMSERFFFHIRNPAGISHDQVGKWLPDQAVAVQEAIRLARLIMNGFSEVGRDWRGWSIWAAREDGEIAFKMTFESIRTGSERSS